MPPVFLSHVNYAGSRTWRQMIVKHTTLMKLFFFSFSESIIFLLFVL